MLVTEAWIALAALALITVGGVMLSRRIIRQAQTYKKERSNVKKVEFVPLDLPAYASN